MDISKVKSSLSVTTGNLTASYQECLSNLEAGCIPPNLGRNTTYETDLYLLPDFDSVNVESEAVKSFASVCEHIAYNNALRLLIIELNVLSAEVRQ